MQSCGKDKSCEVFGIVVDASSRSSLRDYGKSEGWIIVYIQKEAAQESLESLLKTDMVQRDQTSTGNTAVCSKQYLSYHLQWVSVVTQSV